MVGLVRICSLIHSCVCLCVIADYRAPRSKAPPPPTTSFQLMVPGTFVCIRYRTTQFGSVPETKWRCVKVERAGLVCETDYGRDDDFRHGYWCYHGGILKFFLLSRILEVREWSEDLSLRLPYKGL